MKGATMKTTIAALVAATALGLAGAGTATGQDLPPGGPDGPPTIPECGVDDPRMPRCVPGQTSAFTFEAVNPANLGQLANTCVVRLDSATPSDAYQTGRLQFRARVDCDHNLRRVEIRTRIHVPGNDHLIRGAGLSADCHGCGAAPVDSFGDHENFGDQPWELRATVRLTLEEGQPPGDPWVLTPGLPPADTSNGTCVPGGTIVKCELRMPVVSTRN